MIDLNELIYKMQNRGSRQKRGIPDEASSSGIGFQPYPSENSGVDIIRSHIKNMEQGRIQF
jgi:hypothetical protein